MHEDDKIFLLFINFMPSTTISRCFSYFETCFSSMMMMTMDDEEFDAKKNLE